MYGLVNEVVPVGESLVRAIAVARTIARNAPAALEASRRLMYRSLDIDEAEFWQLQQPLIDEVFTSDDAKEGPRAFAEKRSPIWTGR
jgi:enoyl-CoA hydratase/carnithine racemase